MFGELSRSLGDGPEARCCLCGEHFPVALKAQTASCPHCHRSVTVEDVRVKMLHWGGGIRTCGHVTVLKKARCLAREVVASEGVTVLGHLEGVIRSGGPVHVAAGGSIKGAVIAPSMTIDEGAVVEGGPFRVPGNYLAEPEIVVRAGTSASGAAAMRAGFSPRTA